jgi:hypothetical protein
MMLLHTIYKEISKNLTFFSVKESFDADTCKRLTELAIFFEFTHRTVLKYKNDEVVDILKQHLISEVNSITENRIFGNLYISYHSIVPYVSIRRFHKIDKFEKYLKVIIENKLFPIETPPHRSMEWDYLLYKIDMKEKVEIPDFSVLNQDFFPQFFDRETTYTLTHALFYLTDFGFADGLDLSINVEELKFKIGCLISKFYEEKDMDIMLELGINYFSLLPLIDLDFSVLDIICHGLKQTNFIEFDWNQETLVKKHHTFFVLGILIALLERQIQSPRLDKDTKNGVIAKFCDLLYDTSKKNKTTSEKGDLINWMPIQTSWEILKNLKSKDFDVESYISASGDNYFLSKSILSYLDILKQRNDLEILWTKEFEELNASFDDQKRLKKEYGLKLQKSIDYISSKL